MNTFTKKDLKSGMIVKTRDGKLHVVVDHYLLGNIMMADDGFLTIDGFENDLTRASGMKKYDAVAVYESGSIREKRCLWEREEIPTFTMAQLQEKVGPFKLAKEDRLIVYGGSE